MDNNHSFKKTVTTPFSLSVYDWETGAPLSVNAADAGRLEVTFNASILDLLDLSVDVERKLREFQEQGHDIGGKHAADAADERRMKYVETY